MNAPANLSLNDQIRARDGDKCWLCAGKLDFKAEPNSKKAPTREHLLAQSLGGTNDLANLVLCHPGCNKTLGVRPVTQKLKLREKHRSNTLKVQAAQQAKAKAKMQPAQVEERSATAAQPGALPEPVAPKPIQASTVAQGPVRSPPTPRHYPEARQLVRWQIATLLASGLACLFLGFSIGLLVG